MKMKLSELINGLMWPETYECVEVYEADEEDGSYTFRESMAFRDAYACFHNKNVSRFDVDKNKGERYHLMVVFE
ncbi:MAG: hypothetical protein MJ116_02760 [Lachnospiraceae bacterium]|nr:hypothetical protein [Lachnospiraceae bacterium]